MLLCLSVKYLFFQNFFGYILALLGGTVTIVMITDTVAVSTELTKTSIKEYLYLTKHLWLQVNTDVLL